ncbi:HAD family hydrolase [Lysobacter humi (ex Lee et al. 2017)]
MAFTVRAITLDLDDTLWPIMPAIDRAEAALDAWLTTHAPRAAERWPLARRQQLRLACDAERPRMAHDMTAQRRWMLERMLAEAGEDATLADGAFEAYFAGRCEVEHYDDTVPALERLAARLPLAAVSNGNACLTRIGLMPLFRFQLGAREFGAAKPEPGIYLAACERLGVAPHEVLHVGDDIELDVVGAARAGLRTCWIDREAREWPHRDPRPDLTFTDLTALADWVDAHLRQDPTAA